jgi:hypothetical protein
MRIDTSVDAQNLWRRFNKLNLAAQTKGKEVVYEFTVKTHSYIRKAISTPVGTTYGDKKLDAAIRRGKASGLGAGRKQRSAPGQPPRRETGRYMRSVGLRFSPKGWVGTVSTTASAVDKKGRRYPWMLESGSKHYAKRPAFKRAQRAMRGAYIRKFVAVIREEVKRSIYR